MAEVIVFGGSGSDEISDGEIDYFLCLENRICTTIKLKDALAENLIQRLRAGADMAAGPHEVELTTVEDDGVTECRLILDNVCRYTLVIGPKTKVKRRAAG